MKKFLLIIFLILNTVIQASELLTLAKENFEAIPQTLIDKKKYKQEIRLGEKLFHEKRLSINDKISCNSCHNLQTFGLDNLATSQGHNGKNGDRNSPSVYNAALDFSQFWDGRASDLENQAMGPILNPVEMGMPNAKAVVDKISQIEEYKKLFKQAKLELTFENIAKAIASFEKTLLTPSRFDDFLLGKEESLIDVEKKGLKKFIDIGCINCHNGPAIGGGMYMKLGLFRKFVS